MQKYRSTITQLEKFNTTLETEIKQLLENEIGKEDIKKLDKLKEKLYSIDLTSKSTKKNYFILMLLKNFYKILVSKQRLLNSIYQS